MGRSRPPATVLDAKASTGIGNPQLVEDMHDIVISFDSTGSTNATTKFQGSIQQEMPDFSAAQSPTNQWDYVQVKDLEDASTLDGDTGVALAGTDDNRQFEVNVNGLRWFCARVTAYSAGAITVKVKPFSND